MSLMWGNENNKRRYSACDLWNIESRNKQHAIMVRFGHMMKEESFFPLPSLQVVYDAAIGLDCVQWHCTTNFWRIWNFLQNFLNFSSTVLELHSLSYLFWETIKQQRFCNLKAACLLFSFSLSTSKVESYIFFPQLPRSDFYHILSSCTSQLWIYYILNQREVQFLKFTADWVMYQRRPRHSAWFQTVSFYLLKGK